MKFIKLIKNKKAISPIFASLILIAIAVIAGIVVYAFTSGTIATMTGGGTVGQEKASVQGVSYDATGDTLSVYATCVEGGPITITGAIVKDSDGKTVAAPTASGTLPAAGTLTTITTGAVNYTWDADESYTVTLTSSDGGSFVSSSFKP